MLPWELMFHKPKTHTLIEELFQCLNNLIWRLLHLKCWIVSGGGSSQPHLLHSGLCTGTDIYGYPLD